MDFEVEIKEEPVWLEGAANISLDSHMNNGAENDTILKVEPQVSIIPKVENDALDPRTEEPSADIKDEIFTEEHTVDELAPCFKGSNNEKNVAVLTRASMHSYDDCCKTFKTRIKLQHHLFTHTNERANCCNVCGSRVSVKSHLKHQTSHSAEKSFCNVCQKMMVLTDTRGTKRCNICGRTFSRKSGLNKHLKTHSTQKAFICNICNKKFSRRYAHKMHQLTHSGYRPFICKICCKTFTRKSTVIRHQLTHSGERPYRCNLCFRAFSQKSSLKQHQFSHSGERPFSCDICKRTFSFKSTLKTHFLVHSRPK